MHGYSNNNFSSEPAVTPTSTSNPKGEQSQSQEDSLQTPPSTPLDTLDTEQILRQWATPPIPNIEMGQATSKAANSQKETTQRAIKSADPQGVETQGKLIRHLTILG